MAKFIVEIIETAVYECAVEAATATIAEHKAEKLFLSKNGIRIGPPFSVEVVDREVVAMKVKR